MPQIMYNDFRYEKFFFEIKNFTEDFPNSEVNGDSDWYLTVTLRDKYLSCYVGLRNADYNTKVRYSLSILNVNNEESNIMVFQRERDFSYAWGCHTFISKSELFEKADQLLPKNTLILVLKVKFQLDNHAIISSYNELPDPQHSFLFHPVIDPKKCKIFRLERQFHELDRTETGQEIRSEIHSIGDFYSASNWYLSLYPNGFDEDHSDLMSVHLCLESSKLPNVEVQGRISLVHDGIKYVGRVFKHTFQASEKLEFNSFYTYRSLQCPPYDFKHNPFILECEIQILNKFSNDCALSNDFQKLFESRSFTDVTIKVGDKSLEAHKLILIARSNVFASMFEANMIETKENVITIKDVDFEIMQEMIRYIYTDKVNDEIMNEIAPSLLLAADKYNLESLVLKCEFHLLENLTKENVFEVLQICDKIQLKNLEQACKDFLKRNIKELIKKPEWIEFAKSQPNLMTETLIEIICRPDFYVSHC